MHDTTAYTGTDNLEVMAEAENYNRYLRDLILDRTTETDTLLDFGAGIGTFTAATRSHGRNVVGVELDDAQRVVMTERGLPCVRSLSDLGTESVNFVFSLNVLEHIEDDKAIADEIFRTLASGGRLLIYVPAFMCLYSAMDRKVGHVRRYRKRPLVDLLRGVGFTITEARYVDSLGFFASLAYRLIGDNTGRIDSGSVRIYDRYIFPLSVLLDRLASPLFGKNLLVVARKP